MNKSETLKILAVLRAAYPNFYVRQSEMDIQAAVSLWHGQFESISYEAVNAAIQALISSRTEGWPPQIGEVKEKIALLMNPDMPTEQEAWNMVRSAIRNSGYSAAEEWAKLPELIRGLVTPSELHEWAVSEDFNPDVAGSNFMRSYRVKSRRNLELEMMPESVRKLISGTTTKLQIGQEVNAHEQD